MDETPAGGRMTFVMTIFRDEDGAYVAECPSIPGCVSQGGTEQEAEDNLREAIRACLEVRAEQGLPKTITVREIEVPL
jgi:predicted RNase H-like HicB family nuclease